MKVIKGLLKTIGILLCVILLAAAGLIGYLSFTEYRPDAVETAEIRGTAAETELDVNVFTVLSWNLGYCALGEESDFFMDGGEQVHPLNHELVVKNSAGIGDVLLAQNADFMLLQEVDSDSTRSGMDETAFFRDAFPDRCSAYAMNFSTKFVPYPWPPIGKVNSGLQTFSRYAIKDASRISLPCPFSWPISLVNLKRCLLVSRVPIAGTEQELVLVNLHLEAYDDGEGKLAQSKQLRSFLEEEYKKGNYVIAGGDWNQIFPDSEKTWPNTHKELWTPGYLDSAELSEHWSYYWDDSVPTCRLLNQPYDPSDTENTQYYVIDGFLVSPNLRIISVETLDEDFACSDHNPVLLTVSMGAAS